MHPADESSSHAPAPCDCRQVPDNWSYLQGREVSVRVRDTVVDSGRVDAVAPDGSILWLAMDGAVGRRLIERHPDMHIQPAANDNHP
jgi:hypothetical protein